MLNQITNDKENYFSNIDNKDIRYASLQNLQDVYEIDTEAVLKVASKLFSKILFPNLIEGHNVKYELNLLAETNDIALNMSL